MYQLQAPKKAETADWNVHEDKVLGFQIKYPKNWFVQPAKKWPENGDAVTDFTNFDPEKVEGRELKAGEYKFTTVKLTKNKDQTLKDFVLTRRSDCCPPRFYGDIQGTTVNSFSAYKDTSYFGTKESPGESNVSAYIQVKENTVFTIGSAGSQEERKIIDLMLSTFKFLD